MGDPEPRDRETIGAGGSEPEATVADLGPDGPPDTPGRTLAGEIDPGQATGGVTLAHETSVTATGDRGRDARRPDRLPPAHRPAPTIAGYEIEGELGRGGMGVVYRARQVRLNRPCALKMILAGAHADPVAAVRFLAEAEAVARLQHPHIVQIHHIGEADGLPFFELEYVEGGSLDRRLDGTPWPARRAATLVEALARGVAEAHRLGIVHRDLKPAQHPARRRRHAQGRRLRPGQDPGRRVGPDGDRVDPGLAQLHGPGAGRGQGQAGRPARRRLRPGGDPVRAAGRPPAVPGDDGPGDARAGQGGRAGAAVAAGAGAAARRRDDRAEVPAEGPGQAVRVGRGAGRGPAAVPGGPADPGAAGLLDRAAAPLGPPEQAVAGLPRA